MREMLIKASLKDFQEEIPQRPFNNMELESVIIPKGWTYLIHGTNSEKLHINLLKEDDFVITGLGLCVVEKEQAVKDASRGFNTSENFQARQEGGSVPFEMRILFYKECIRNQDTDGLKQKLPQETLEDIKKYYFKNIKEGRHPLVPPKTKLIKIMQRKENGIDVIYYVPEKYIDEYMKDRETSKVPSLDDQRKKYDSKYGEKVQAFLERNGKLYAIVDDKPSDQSEVPNKVLQEKLKQKTDENPEHNPEHNRLLSIPKEVSAHCSPDELKAYKIEFVERNAVGFDNIDPEKVDVNSDAFKKFFAARQKEENEVYNKKPFKEPVERRTLW